MPDHAAQPKTGFLLGNITYDNFRYAVQYWIPALGTFYAGLATIWGLPFGVEVVGSLTALGTLLGIMMGVSKSTYNKTGAGFDGQFLVDEENGRTVLDVQTPVDEMAKQELIKFKVKHEPGAHPAVTDESAEAPSQD